MDCEACRLLEDGDCVLLGSFTRLHEHSDKVSLIVQMAFEEYISLLSIHYRGGFPCLGDFEFSAYAGEP